MSKKDFAGDGGSHWIDRAAKALTPSAGIDQSNHSTANRRTFVRLLMRLSGGAAIVATTGMLDSSRTEAQDAQPFTHSCATGCTRVFNYGCEACVDFETKGYLCTCEFCRDSGELCDVYDCDYTGYDPICS